MFGLNRSNSLSVGTGGANQPAQSGGLFGSSAAQPATAGGLFGNSTQNAQAGSLFSTTPASKPQQTGSLFGGASTGFGSTSGGLNPGTQSGGLFGASQNSTPAAGGLFGNAAKTSAPATGGLFGASTATPTPAAGGGLFGGAASSAPSGGLFGATASAAPAGGLFGTTTSTATTGGLFGTAASSAPSLFGSTAPAAPKPSLFGASTAAPASSSLFATPASTAPSGGLFGATTTSAPSGGLFGSTATSAAPTGGLFGNTTTSAPTSSLFGNTSTSAPAKPSLFGSISTQPTATGSLFATASTTNNLQAQQTVPGVKIDISQIRGTTRFADLHDNLKEEIEKLDNLILQQMEYAEKLGASLSGASANVASLAPDVALLSSKIDAVESAAENSAYAIKDLKTTVSDDVEDAKLSFQAIENIKLPPAFHYQQDSAPSTTSSDGQRIIRTNDIVAYFLRTQAALNSQFTDYISTVGETEAHLRMMEATLIAKSDSLLSRRIDGVQNGGNDRMQELTQTLRLFEEAIVNVASRIGAVRQEMTNVSMGIPGANDSLGGRLALTNGHGVNGRASVYGRDGNTAPATNGRRGWS